MEKIATFSQKERMELFRATAAKKGVLDALIEKDFWVCLVLKTIFEKNDLSKHLLFKGGTSLSKCYSLINRFSEDIDLVLDWGSLGITDEEAWKDRSATQQDKFNEHIDVLGKEFIANSIAPSLKKILIQKSNGQIEIKIDPSDSYIINVHYPATFKYTYLLDYIKLEIGPRASRIPQENITISSYAALAYPKLFEQKDFTVKVISSERTFWEKATILHQIASFEEDKPVPLRYSRHYYDMYQMINSDLKNKVLTDLGLLQDVVKFKSKFYRSPKARYDLAKPDTLKLLPSLKKQKVLIADYQSMKEMIFGDIPEFSDIIYSLSQLEKEINQQEIN